MSRGFEKKNIIEKNENNKLGDLILFLAEATAELDDLIEEFPPNDAQDDKMGKLDKAYQKERELEIKLEQILQTLEGPSEFSHPFYKRAYLDGFRHFAKVGIGDQKGLIDLYNALKIEGRIQIERSIIKKEEWLKAANAGMKEAVRLEEEAQNRNYPDISDLR